MEILICAFVAISAIAVWLLIKGISGQHKKTNSYPQQVREYVDPRQEVFHREAEKEIEASQQQVREYVDPRQEVFHRKAEKEIEASQLSDSRKSEALAAIAETEHEVKRLADARPDGSRNLTDVDLIELLPATFVVLDLETTGLSPSENEIIEIGAIKFELGANVHDGFQLLLRPEREIAPKIEMLTGITQHMLNRDGVEPAVALKAFSEFVSDLPLVTFNAPFDMGFLWNAGKKHGVSFKNRYTCALQLSRKAWPEFPSHRLADLAERAGLSDEDTHRALADSKRALQIFIMAVTTLGSRVQWERQPIDWHVMVNYNKAKEANQAFCEEVRSLEESSTEEAVRMYIDAIDRMYEYEAMVDGRYADAYIIDRLSLCLWKIARYRELVEGVDKFIGIFPEVKSSVMTGVLRRRERAEKKASMVTN